MLANGNSSEACVSEDGQFVAFDSRAGNLVTNDGHSPDYSYVYVRDTVNDQTKIASLTDDGALPGNHSCQYPAISGDGRYVAFESTATTLVTGDQNGKKDVFARDMLSNRTFRVSVRDDGTEGTGGFFGSAFPAISGDGRYVAFETSFPSAMAKQLHDRQISPSVMSNIKANSCRHGIQGHPRNQTHSSPEPHQPSRPSQAGHSRFEASWRHVGQGRRRKRLVRAHRRSCL